MIQEFQLATDDKSEVLAACLLRGLETRQPIRQEDTAGSQMTLYSLVDRLRPEAVNNTHPHMDGVALVIQSNGGDKGRLAGCAATALSPAMLASPVGIIQLDDAADGSLLVAGSYSTVPRQHRRA